MPSEDSDGIFIERLFYNRLTQRRFLYKTLDIYVYT